MPVSAALERLARYGLWLDPREAQAKAWIEENTQRLKLSFDETAKRLQRDPRGFAAAIRRQWYANVLWYAHPALQVLEKCSAAPDSEVPLLHVLGLQEGGSSPPLELGADGVANDAEGVVLDAGIPVAVSLVAPQPKLMAPRGGTLGGGGMAGAGILTRATRSEPTAAPPAPQPVEVRAWPRIDAPGYQPAAVPFDVTVGLAEGAQAGVSGGPVSFIAPAGIETIDVGVELIADGIDAPGGWVRTLRVAVKNPTAATVSFRLVGREPQGPEPMHLTTLEVRYVVGGAVCGTASRRLVIGRANAPHLAAPADIGTPWLAHPGTCSSVNLGGDAHVADLTIEIAKPDDDGSNGRYVCRLSSPHPVALDPGPHRIDVGHDARTFAKMMVDTVRMQSGSPLVDSALRSLRQLVADNLPQAAFDGLRAVAQRVAPQPPAVLIVSAEPFVPWELAEVDPPLDPARPPYLGAQALVGRWLRHGARRNGAPAPNRERPACVPLAAIPVRHMAVMAGYYKAESGLRNLPAAEKEANALALAYDAVMLAASPEALSQLLKARLEHRFQQIGAPGAVHFAGHGDYDPTRPDSATLFLSDGKPLTSFLFRNSAYGGERQPLFFLNACMLGIGGEVLGEISGFPGDCLKGGFGGLLGALWEVDDEVAAEIAQEFWRRALPTNGSQPEPVAAILRDLRAKYDADAAAPVSTYLSYVYYGHPRLTLQRVA